MTTQDTTPRRIEDCLVALFPDARVTLARYAERGRLDADWIAGIKGFTDGGSVHASHWERHPRGEEVLCLLEGRITVTLGAPDNAERSVPLEPGQLIVVPRGHWHRLEVHAPGRLLFITPSVGSEVRRVDSGLPAPEAFR
ncbi:cupin domain-containing protein [Cupriavidus agavae]|uniref:Cupin domain n=1 Tax=Cupriavidus agavae TaxID=1001822 RepID=A0A4Q7S2E9_9BURK|nr:cupin domain-containing protein [Cupriavidus agavae]RZT39410.1 cupin domain [Cupriavidus agavae]